MIAGIGIDTIDIQRFKGWHTYSEKKLRRIFTPDEIAYCMATPLKTAERFAVRFAAKEAFYKAFSEAYPNHTIPLLVICKNMWVCPSNTGKPELRIHWEILQQQPLKSFVSLTHTPTIATAIIILENLSN